MLDIHCHLLPGVDDGAQNPEMTRQMMLQAINAGVTCAVATPHVYKIEDFSKIPPAYRTARGIARQAGLGLVGGMELSYRALSAFTPEDMGACCMVGTRSFLLELSNAVLLPRWEAVLSEFVQHGYYPIIAHPERYEYIQKDLQVALEMRSYGCELQIDAHELFAGRFSQRQRTARKLLEEGLVDYIASDAHLPEHYGRLERARKQFGSQWPRHGRVEKALLQGGSVQ